jgi:hypothetical protein
MQSGYSHQPQQLNHYQQLQHQQPQFSQNINFSHLLSDASQFDVQSELESLFVNATLSDVTLASNITETSDDNSNTSSSTKLRVTGGVDLNDDELCDIEMNLNFINMRNESESKVRAFHLSRLCIPLWALV